MPAFDIQQTAIVDTLIAIPLTERDPSWGEKFCAAIVNASMTTIPQQVMQGPDTYPYFVLNLPPIAQQFHPVCLASVLDVCLDHGVGIAVEPQREPPGWIFSYGDLWSFKTTSTFRVPKEVTPDPQDQVSLEGRVAFVEHTIVENRQITVGQATEDFFPVSARRNIKRYLSSLPFYAQRPVRSLVLRDPHFGPQLSLAFNFFPDDFTNLEQFKFFGQMFRWFFPSHYDVTVVEKNSPLATHFKDL